MLGHLESNRPAGLLLADRCTVDRMSMRRNVLDLDRDDIAPAQLAVDRQIEHRQVARTSLIWSLVRIDHTCFGRSGGLAPISLPLFQAMRLGAVGT